MLRNTLAGAAVLALAAGPALADSWLESMARQTAGRAVVNGVVNDTTKSEKSKKAPKAKDEPAAPAEAPPAPVAQQDPNVSSEDPFAEPGVPAPAAYAAAPAAPAATSGPAPWPINAGQKLSSPQQMKFDPSLEAAKTEFREFSRYSCNDCEGGHGYDAWARHYIATSTGQYHAFENALGALSVGQSVSWKGKASDGKITVVGDTPVAGFQCRQLKWEMKRRKDGVVATRDGLICRAESSKSWDEVI